MRSIIMFGEDSAHRTVIDALVRRIARELELSVDSTWQCSAGGHGRVVSELREYVAEARAEHAASHDLVLVATDSNCDAYKDRVREIRATVDMAPLVLAVPDPHVERWLLLDGEAFKSVFGKGCPAPDRKCERGRYKTMLDEAILAAQPRARGPAGGITFGEAIIQHMDLDRAAGADASFRHFVESLRRQFRAWRN